MIFVHGDIWVNELECNTPLIFEEKRWTMGFRAALFESFRFIRDTPISNRMRWPALQDREQKNPEPTKGFSILLMRGGIVFSLLLLILIYGYIPPASATDASAVTTILQPSTFLSNSIALSPDGSTLAFSSRSQSYQKEQYDLWIVKTDGTDSRLLAGMDSIDAISWHPDGTSLIFAGLRNGTYQVWIIRTDGTDLARITDARTNAIPCGFDPTGEYILYTLEKASSLAPESDISTRGAMQKPVTGSADLFIKRLNTTIARRIASDVATVRMQVVSFPGMKAIYYIRPTWVSDTRFIIPKILQGKPDLVRYTIDGKEEGVLTTTGDCTFSDWSLEESALAYRSGFEIRILDPVNSDNRLLTRPAGDRSTVYYDYPVKWRPGMSQIAYVRYGNVHLINRDGTGDVQLTLNPINSLVTDHIWSRDGRFLYAISRDRILQIDVMQLTADPSLAPEVIEISGNPGVYQPSWSPDGSEIAYVQRRSGTVVSLEKAIETDIFILNLESRTKRRLTSTGDAISPAWSPDGTKIAYTRTNYLTSRIWVTETTVNKTRPVSPTLDYARYPVWSPDGRSIAYLNAIPAPEKLTLPTVIMNSGKAELVVIDADGKDRRVILSTVIQGDSQTIRWSRDSTAIMAFNGTISSANGTVTRSFVWITDPSGRNKTWGTSVYTWTSPISKEWVSLSASGKSVVFRDIPDKGQNLIRRLDANGAVTTVLTNLFGITGIQYNPVNDQIAYFDTSLWSVDGNGENKRSLADVTDHKGQVMAMSWSPDGSRIAYLDSGIIWLVEADGTNRRQLSPFMSIGGTLDWSPDGRWVMLTFNRLITSSPSYAWGANDGSSEPGVGPYMSGAIVLVDAGVPVLTPSAPMTKVPAIRIPANPLIPVPSQTQSAPMTKVPAVRIPAISLIPVPSGTPVISLPQPTSPTPSFIAVEETGGSATGFIGSYPSGSEVEIDGVIQDLPTPAYFIMNRGTRTIRISHAGYHEKRFSYPFTKSEQRTTVYLQPDTLTSSSEFFNKNGMTSEAVVMPYDSKRDRLAACYQVCGATYDREFGECQAKYSITGYKTQETSAVLCMNAADMNQSDCSARCAGRVR